VWRLDPIAGRRNIATEGSRRFSGGCHFGGRQRDAFRGLDALRSRSGRPPSNRRSWTTIRGAFPLALGLRQKRAATSGPPCLL
jgi:hypothetical protein